MATVLGNPNTMNRLVAPAGANMNTGVQPQPQVQPQPTQQQPQQTHAGGNSIPYWGYYGNQSYFDSDPTSGQPGMDFLHALRQYDPNATFVSSSGGGEGDAGATRWTLQYDRSKLPGRSLGGGNVDMNPGDYAPTMWSPNDHGESFADYKRLNPGVGNFRGRLFNPNAIGTDPVYGRVTSPQNVMEPDPDFITRYGPAIIGAIGMFGGLGPLGSMLMKAPQTIAGMTQGRFNPFQLASMAVPFIPGIGNVPFLSSAARMGLNYVGSHRRGG